MPAGDIIIEEEPYAHVLLQKQRGLCCDWCLEKYVPIFNWNVTLVRTVSVG